jgi:hypothetical protein
MMLPKGTSEDSDSPSAACRSSLGGDLLLGAAAALKATAAIYAPGALIGALAVRNQLTRSASPLLSFCLGWAVAFVAMFGWWGYRVFQATHNPVFPMLNNLFRSDWFPPVDFFWRQPHGLFKIIFFPFFWFDSNYEVAQAHLRWALRVRDVGRSSSIHAARRAASLSTPYG